MQSGQPALQLWSCAPALLHSTACQQAQQGLTSAALLQDDEEREAEIKTIEAARYAREMELAHREAAEEKLRRKQAYLK